MDTLDDLKEISSFGLQDWLKTAIYRKTHAVLKNYYTEHNIGRAEQNLCCEIYSDKLRKLRIEGSILLDLYEASLSMNRAFDDTELKEKFYEMPLHDFIELVAINEIYIKLNPQES